MTMNLDFIMESLERSKTITIQIKNGVLQNEKIKCFIKRLQSDPEVATYINNHRQSGDMLKEILYAILERTERLDRKLKMKLDIVLNNKALRFDGVSLIIG